LYLLLLIHTSTYQKKKEIVHGVGERFSVCVGWFRNLSTSVLEIGVLFLYDLIIGIRWALWWSSLGIGLLLILA
jgi:hypothetical protein